MSLHTYQHVAELLLDSGDHLHHQHSGDDDLSDEEDCIYCVLAAPATLDFSDSTPQYLPATHADIASFPFIHAGEPVPAGFSLRAPPSVNV
jgi:hypothetical protein